MLTGGPSVRKVPDLISRSRVNGTDNSTADILSVYLVKSMLLIADAGISRTGPGDGHDCPVTIDPVALPAC